MTIASTSTAHVPTAHASRYLQQLCKHWSHRFEVEFDTEHGRILLTGGVAELTAKPDMLDVRLTADDAERLAALKQVVATHLDRFAFREAPLPFAWERG